MQTQHKFFLPCRKVDESENFKKKIKSFQWHIKYKKERYLTVMNIYLWTLIENETKKISFCKSIELSKLIRPYKTSR